MFHNTTHLASSLTRLNIGVCLCVLTVLLLGCADSKVENACIVVKKSLTAPSSFSLVSSEVVWEGVDTAGHPAFIVGIEYDAQNGFGAVIRDCKLVAYTLDGDKIRWDPFCAFWPCEGIQSLDKKFQAKLMLGMNFGLRDSTALTRK